MSKISLPKFTLFGKDDPSIEEKIQPKLGLRDWDDVSNDEKKIAIQGLRAFEEFDEDAILGSIARLNLDFLRIHPGKNLLHIPRGTFGEQVSAAFKDFLRIFCEDKQEIVYRMITVYADKFIDKWHYSAAERATTEAEANRYVSGAFSRFDVIAANFNHIFEQFSVNIRLTRQGLLPRQDEKIVSEVFVPTLQILSGVKWRKVSEDLRNTFTKFHSGDFAESITQIHVVLQRFLQDLLGHGNNGKGELAELFREAKEKGYIPKAFVTEEISNALKGYISSARATKGSAKPSKENATASDALLVINFTMILIQYCLAQID